MVLMANCGSLTDRELALQFFLTPIVSLGNRSLGVLARQTQSVCLFVCMSVCLYGPVSCFVLAPHRLNVAAAVIRRPVQSRIIELANNKSTAGSVCNRIDRFPRPITTESCRRAGQYHDERKRYHIKSWETFETNVTKITTATATSHRKANQESTDPRPSSRRVSSSQNRNRNRNRTLQ